MSQPPLQRQWYARGFLSRSTGWFAVLADVLAAVVVALTRTAGPGWGPGLPAR